MKRPLLIFSLFLFIQLIFSGRAHSQTRITGHVYDSTGIFPLAGTTVMSSSGSGTMTDSNGHYMIIVSPKDSIWFSYLGKATIKYPVIEIMGYPQFDISIRVGIPVLKEVKVRSPDRTYDSIQNRIEYAKVFNYQKPSFRSIVTSISITGITIDINELIRAFQKKKIRSILSFQQRLLQAEHEEFIDHCFTKALVGKITDLKEEELDAFMRNHRPGYDFLLHASAYDLGVFIKNEYEKYKALKR